MRVFVYVPPFISQILDFIYWTVLFFILIYFEWRDTENQQYTTYTSGSTGRSRWGAQGARVPPNFFETAPPRSQDLDDCPPPPPLSEGLDLPKWVHILASTVQPIYASTLILWPHSFEPNVNIKKHFILLFWRPASFGHLLFGPTVVTLSPGSTVHCIELYFV